MTLHGTTTRAPRATQAQTPAPQQQSSRYGAMTALAGAPIGGAPVDRRSSGEAVAMKLPR